MKPVASVWQYLPFVVATGAIILVLGIARIVIASSREDVRSNFEAFLNRQVLRPVDALRIAQNANPVDAKMDGPLDPLIAAWIRKTGEAPTELNLASTGTSRESLEGLLGGLPKEQERQTGFVLGLAYNPADRQRVSRPVLYRRSAKSVEIMVLDHKELDRLARIAAETLAPGISVKAAWQPTAPVTYLFQIPEEVLSANAPAAGLWSLAIVGGLLCAGALGAGAWLFHRQRQQLERERIFAAAVSHELKTPVAALKALTENLENGTVRSEKRQAEYLRLISSEAKRLERVVGNVLHQVRMMQGQVHLTLRTQTMNAAVLATAGRWRESTIETDLDQLADVVAADQDAIERILDNLLENARKYAPGSPIIIRTKHNGAGASITVEDQGPGIPLADQRRVLEAWQRSAGHEHQPGLGLGLSLVSGLVKAHGGTITLESVEPHGLRVVIKLPMGLDRYLTG